MSGRLTTYTSCKFNLKGEFKWSLTGTPLQNRVGELYSLIRFMQAGTLKYSSLNWEYIHLKLCSIDPFAYYYCKNCPCKQLTWKFSDKKGCDDCGHTPMR